MNLSGKQPLGLKPDPLTPAEIREGKEYMRIVKELPCCVCGRPGPSDAHHPIHDRYGTRRAPDMHVIPLCKSCHQNGPDAIHNGKQTWREKHGPDHGYIEETQRKVSDILLIRRLSTFPSSIP